MADYYELLEIPRSASEQDIRKAYRRLALKWHPDKNPEIKEEAGNKFKEISEAYEVLCDKDKRSIYDRYGKDGLTPGSSGGRGAGPDFGFGFNFHSPDEIFRNFFGTNDPFSTFFDDDIPGFGGSLFSRNKRGPSNKRNEQPRSNLFSNQFSDQFADPFGGFGFGFSSSFGQDPFGNSSFSTFPNFGGIADGGRGSGGGANMRSTSTSTKFVNGKKITKKKTVENGKETVEEYENDTLIKCIVDGRPLQITQ